MKRIRTSALATAAGLALASNAIAQAPAATPSVPEALAPAKVSLLERPQPNIDTLADDDYGRLARRGHELATRTFAHIGPEVKDKTKRYAGNNLSCTSCHQENATKPFAIPWVGVTSTFPQYRGREDALSTVEERVNGCMERSMNGRALPLDSPEMKAFVTYIHFLSRGIPVGAEIEGSATKAVKVPNRRADLAAGQAVFQAQCQVCHGENGEGRRVGVAGDAQGYIFPPLWGPDTFNNGAGMNRILTAVRFIKHNMPQGVNYQSPVLSDDEAFDVAGYILSKARPVKANLEKDFPARWNKPIDAAFPPYVDGAPADQHKYGPFPPLAEKAREMAAKHAESLKEGKAQPAAR
ncbi:cytochrome c family protein [Azoarcus olearius]|uniref:c-type cytochrome n=1 Tax=Azoarcus sp. (strain BH72) TaxID=418699 RepID=UPI0008063B5A|nr:c-type cytochrome [Azoarcus olearius]ANQ85844.1 cytochrome c family protein [Azoarcus olearius]